MKIHKKTHQIRETSIICSHIWYVDIPKCVYQLDIQSVKVWWRYNNSDMNDLQLCMKIPKKT